MDILHILLATLIVQQKFSLKQGMFHLHSFHFQIRALGLLNFFE